MTEPQASELRPRNWRVIGAALAGLTLAALLVAAGLHFGRAYWGAEEAVRVDLPKTPPPAVEPVVIQAVAPEVAKKVNEMTPFTKGPVPPARPFRLAATGADIERATSCLAAAVYYEAGSENEAGKRAVAQVVINRLRHPAYPNSVCGVVFQGHERATGCQFTFTCDGSLRRTPSAAGWRDAMQIARAALSGSVYAPVGLATHYHTDWVLPVWSSKLDKIRAEGTHLFFRWHGYWGTPPAFRNGWAGSEPIQSKLGQLAAAHFDPAAPLETPLEPFDAAKPVDVAKTLAKARLVATNLNGDSFIMTVGKGIDGSTLADIAQAQCNERIYCKIFIWTSAATAPKSFPMSEPQMASASFTFLRNRAAGFEKPLWNCKEFRRDKSQCIKDRAPLPAPAPPQPGMGALGGAGMPGSE